MTRKKSTKAKPSMKITEEQFSLFKNECKEWIEIFGLKYWDARYFLKDIDKKYYAETTYAHDGRAVDLWLNNDWSDLNASPGEYELKKTAFHEVMEVFLYPLRYLAESRYVLGPEEIDCAIHNVIRTLENVVFSKTGDSV